MRDSKKADRKAAIENAALELFSQLGFMKTTISLIAERAGFGTGTLYNYFKTKGDILFSIIEKRSCGYVEELDCIIKENIGFLESLMLFHDAYLNSLSLYNKVIWRECMASIFSGDAELMKSINEVDRPYLERLNILFFKFQKTGIISETADIESMIATLYDADMYAILTYLADEDMPLATLKNRLTMHAKMITS
ncbi:MAG: TetR/AcrR family transcriptional regulator [Spirochaetes bacterium]|nr:TetR/AcrR family transcriptional regulator [Spirochaetota bacterium]MBN2770242.1 TetR/AcrR family transcriptional regulator [Spirochaetota bacterium]